MKPLIAAVLCALIALSTAHAQEKGDAKKVAPAAVKKAEQAKKEPSVAQKKQQARMKDCSAEAKTKGVKGDERKSFMSTCLKG